MSDNQLNNNRIAKNTILLYFRMILTMGVSLYTSRVVLQVLGVNDFGIYNVVGGVVALFTFLNSAMASSTQRFLNYELGKGNHDRLKIAFSTSINIHFIISIIVLVVTELVGLWFLYNKMNISADRINATFWVFQFSLVSCVITILSTPYNGAIIAHEKMSAFAYISLMDVILKLIIVYFISLFEFDKLIFYGFLLMLVSIIDRFIYGVYCSKHFEETKYTFVFDIKLSKEMASLAGWNLFGHLSSILVTQGVNMLLNVFFGPAVNAARGIAVQVQGAVQGFASNFQSAINPQITKSYAQNDKERMYMLIKASGRYSFYLLLIFALPIMFLAPEILKIWLKDVPDYTTIFLRLIFIGILIDSPANSLMIASQATGKVRSYQMLVGGILLLNLPISYILLKLNYGAPVVFVVAIIVSLIAHFLRIIKVHHLIGISIKDYIKNVDCNCILVLTLSVILPILIYCYVQVISFVFCVFFSFICILTVLTSTFFVGLSSNERSSMISILNKYKNKFI